ncbi:hypothetical protein BD830_10151 [Maritimibacter alkaliphilus HTCC2654]|uniref:Lipoprotein n=1 Tax=Maritimibacter alkaliphilus HTCC2654 TaxID=314271 RepID=A3VEZ9_9RHOB|nr:hypothetical protein [Maritimibacter alkaliphilus]EAQ12914.1 hypothetical protein RB2654_10468 [Rhodobacterales bacterium HTCC2654] [Maritimibacter alkaliphilus HTCC2654]TYP85094.1 hypothetical protein BD830_10151 [Maritimibacter alkaliphilus HTCC2654]
MIRLAALAAFAVTLVGCTDSWTYEKTGRAVIHDGVPYDIYALKAEVTNTHGGLPKVTTAEVVRVGDKFLQCEPDCGKAVFRELVK